MANQTHYRFEVQVDPARDIMRYVLAGFFDLPGVMALAAERRTKAAALTCPPNRHVTLVDIGDLNLQSQAVLPAFEQLINEPAGRSRKVAFITGVSLARMQIRRLSNRSEIRVFACRDEAEAWLFAAETDAEAA